MLPRAQLADESLSSMGYNVASTAAPATTPRKRGMQALTLSLPLPETGAAPTVMVDNKKWQRSFILLV